MKNTALRIISEIPSKPKSSYAARVASATFVLYVKNEIENNMNKYKTTEDLKNLCQYAIALAHQTIVDLELAEGKNPGTCTVCAGIIVPLLQFLYCEITEESIGLLIEIIDFMKLSHQKAARDFLSEIESESVVSSIEDYIDDSENQDLIKKCQIAVEQ